MQPMRKLIVICIFGTRPEAIKMAPVVAELRRRSDSFTPSVCVTAQHREMLDDVLDLFDIVADHDLDVMQDAQTPGYVAASVLKRLETILEAERPDWILVQGDTTTTMAAALSGFYNRVKVGHIEAGLRTRRRWQPFPEEINRRMATVVTDLHFAPTQRARDNLLSEGVPEQDVIVTGNTVIDALLDITSRPFDWTRSALSQIADSANRTILLTAHRRESFGEPIRNICRAAREIALGHDDIQIVYPVHPNPNVIEAAHAELDGVPNVHLIDPLDYLTLAHLMKRSYLILTDSGGIQEEAPSLGVPVLVLRDVTERPEAVDAGAARLVGTDTDIIVKEATRLLDSREEYSRMANVDNPFGDGHASRRIALALLERH